jgi:hypothetical protein
MTQLLVGLAGKARSGKDTVGKLFHKHFGFEPYAIAGAMKRGLREMFDIPLDVWDKPEKDDIIKWIGRSPRYLAQTIGTEWGRDCVAKDIWVRVMLNRWETLQRIQPTSARMIVTDVRFDNEAEAIRDRGGFIFRVVRSGVREVESHDSERGIDLRYIHGTLFNDGPLLELESSVMAVGDQLLSWR